MFPVLFKGPPCIPTVYGLADGAEPDRIRYVGATTDPAMRYRGHLGGVRGRVGEWVGALLSSGGTLVMVQIEQCTEQQLCWRERYWLEHLVGLDQADLNTKGALLGRERRPSRSVQSHLDKAA